MTARHLRVWRITDARFARSALSGAGGLAASGRWHERGVPIVYASESPELAVLETLVNVPVDLVPPTLMLIGVDIDRRVRLESIDASALPANWRQTPAPSALRDIGMRWLGRGRSAGLWVPSAVVPMSRNLVINPRHADASAIRITSRERFPLDPRLRPPRRRPSAR